jgi:Chalcone isomerase-like
MVTPQQCLVSVLIAVAGLCGSAAFAQTTVGGIRFEPEVNLSGQKLKLNGAGIRYRAIFKVYAAGLYLADKASQNEDVLKDSVAKRLHLVALRDVGGDEFGKLFTRGMEANTSAQEFGKLIAPVIRMGQLFGDAKQLKQGDVITIDYAPSTGMVLSLRGKPLGEAFKEPGFQALMYKIWFGSKPVDEALRGALLGENTTANNNTH